MTDDDLNTRPIEELLIQVAAPASWEDSPERKTAWDEIKRRDAALSEQIRANAVLRDERDHLDLALRHWKWRLDTMHWLTPEQP